jgi:hypothetical protein
MTVSPIAELKEAQSQKSELSRDQEKRLTEFFLSRMRRYMRMR